MLPHAPPPVVAAISGSVSSPNSLHLGTPKAMRKISTSASSAAPPTPAAAACLGPPPLPPLPVNAPARRIIWKGSLRVGNSLLDGLTFQSSQPLPDHLIFREASSSTDDAAAPGSSSAAQATTPSRATFPPSSYAALPPTPPPTSAKPTSPMEGAESTEFTEMLALRETTCLRLRERTVRLDACGGLRTPSEDGEQGVRVIASATSGSQGEVSTGSLRSIMRLLIEDPTASSRSLDSDGRTLQAVVLSNDDDSRSSRRGSTGTSCQKQQAQRPWFIVYGIRGINKHGKKALQLYAALYQPIPPPTAATLPLEHDLVNAATELVSSAYTEGVVPAKCPLGDPQDEDERDGNEDGLPDPPVQGARKLFKDRFGPSAVGKAIPVPLMRSNHPPPVVRLTATTMKRGVPEAEGERDGKRRRLMSRSPEGTAATTDLDSPPSVGALDGRGHFEVENRMILRSLAVTSLVQRGLAKDHPEFKLIWGFVVRGAGFSLRESLSTCFVSPVELSEVVDIHVEAYLPKALRRKAAPASASSSSECLSQMEAPAVVAVAELAVQTDEVVVPAAAASTSKEMPTQTDPVFLKKMASVACGPSSPLQPTVNTLPLPMASELGVSTEDDAAPLPPSPAITSIAAYSPSRPVSERPPSPATFMEQAKPAIVQKAKPPAEQDDKEKKQDEEAETTDVPLEEPPAETAIVSAAPSSLSSISAAVPVSPLPFPSSSAPELATPVRVSARRSAARSCSSSKRRLLPTAALSLGLGLDYSSEVESDEEDDFSAPRNSCAPPSLTITGPLVEHGSTPDHAPPSSSCLVPSSTPASVHRPMIVRSSLFTVLQGAEGWGATNDVIEEKEEAVGVVPPSSPSASYAVSGAGTPLLALGETAMSAAGSLPASSIEETKRDEVLIAKTPIIGLRQLLPPSSCSSSFVGRLSTPEAKAAGGFIPSSPIRSILGLSVSHNTGVVVPSPSPVDLASTTAVVGEDEDDPDAEGETDDENDEEGDSSAEEAMSVEMPVIPLPAIMGQPAVGGWW